MTPGILAADKTWYIEELDKSLQYEYMFLRPWRWGKSTFLQTLASYYDKTKAAEFEDIFGQLYIGKHPTPSRNSLLVLLFDFSLIQTADNFEKSFHQTLNRFLRTFLIKNAEFLGYPDPDDFLKELVVPLGKVNDGWRMNMNSQTCPKDHRTDGAPSKTTVTFNPFPLPVQYPPTTPLAVELW
jgi:hypothetical protein